MAKKITGGKMRSTIKAAGPRGRGVKKSASGNKAKRAGLPKGGARGKRGSY